MTTRKPLPPLRLTLPLPIRRAICAWVGVAALALASGCATPGPLHVYSLASQTAAVVGDRGAERAADTPSFLAKDDVVTGFAYDPFTDHFFLRLAPGNRIRVVDRPARAIKREYEVKTLPATGGGDLAVRPRGGHVFAAHPREAALVEFSRFGDAVRVIALVGASAPPRGVAYDATRDELLVLDGGAARRVARYAPDGTSRGALALDRDVAGGALGFDPTARELYAPLAGGGTSGGVVGVFGEDGKLRRELPLRAALLDVGERSFLRMF